MLIINNNNTQLVFGVGDQIGYKRFKSPNAIQFVEVVPLSVGTSIEIERLDIVISQFKKLREVMGGSYDERTTD